MLMTVLIFIFSKFFSFIFFRQIWSQNLKFCKLTKIWYRGRLLYAYLDFNVYFFRIFVIHIFWANKLKFDTGLHCYMSITILIFSISKFCHSYNFRQIWAKSNVLHIDWNLMQRHIVICWLKDGTKFAHILKFPKFAWNYITFYITFEIINVKIVISI